MPTRILAVASNMKILIAIWAFLFVLTLVFSELDTRALLSAFFAWCGGLLTARVDHELRMRHAMKSWQADMLKADRKRHHARVF